MRPTTLPRVIGICGLALLLQLLPDAVEQRTRDAMRQLIHRAITLFHSCALSVTVSFWSGLSGCMSMRCCSYAVVVSVMRPCDTSAAISEPSAALLPFAPDTVGLATGAVL